METLQGKDVSEGRLHKKYQFFVSSTFNDLQDERRATIRTILDIGHIPAGMELFPATDIEQLEYIKKIIDECDYYILIVGGRYGSYNSQGISFTELEYDYAITEGKIVLCFIHGDPMSIPVSKTDLDPDSRSALDQFKEKVSKGRLVKYWKDKHALDATIAKSVHHALEHHPMPGWMRGDGIAYSEIQEEIYQLRSKIASLEAENRQLRQYKPSGMRIDFDIDDQIDINFKRKKRKRTRQGVFSTTLKDVFLAVGHSFAGPVQTHLLSEIISRYVCEEREMSSAIVSEDDVAFIREAFIRCGFFESRMGQDFSGYIVEYIRLTDRGREFLR